MSFAIHLPGWNSLDSVRHIHSEFEGAALLFFALLVLFEVLAHRSPEKSPRRERRLETIALWCFGVAVFAEIVAYPYGQRNDALSEQVIGSLDVKARDAAKNSSTALTNSQEADKSAEAAVSSAANAQALAHSARQEADTFERDLRRVQRRVADRHLTPIQQADITEKLCAFGGRNVQIGIYNADGEINSLSKDILGVLPIRLPAYCLLGQQHLGWAVETVRYQASVGFSGMQIVMRDWATEDDERFAAVLADALRLEDLDVEGPMRPPRRGSYMSGGADPDSKQFTMLPRASIEIAISKKP